MFAKVYNLAAVTALAMMMSACGGGDATQPEMSQAGASAASAGLYQPAPAAQGAQSVAPGAIAGDSAAPAGYEGHAMASTRIESSVITMHGGGASVITTTGDGAKMVEMRGSSASILTAVANNPDLASETERERMLLEMVDYERSYSIEMNRQHAEQKAAEAAMQQGAAIGAECVDPANPECKGAN